MASVRLAETDNAALYQSLKQIFERNPKPKDLPSLKTFVDSLLTRAPRDMFLAFILELFGASDEIKVSARSRWEAEGSPRYPISFPTRSIFSP